MKFDKFLRLAETFISLQGEGLHAGLPCFFIRTAGCDLHCNWCDTEYARSASAGKWFSLDEIVNATPEHIELVMITGGEPLLHEEKIKRLSEELIRLGKKILLETGGHRPIKNMPNGAHIVMDIKLPSSGENDRDFHLNFPYLKKSDEIKFVVGSRLDFETAVKWIESYQLAGICNLTLSPVWETTDLKSLAGWILESKLPFRLQIQLHKIIWGPETKGV